MSQCIIIYASYKKKSQYSRNRLKVKLSIALIAIMIVWSDESLAQDYYGIPIEESGVAFLLDISGSMEDKNEGGGIKNGLLRGAIKSAAKSARNTRVGQTGIGEKVLNRVENETTKLGAARRELFAALGSLTGWTKFTIITFGDQAQEWPGGIRLAGREERLAAQTYAMSLSADGGTPMAEALRLGFHHSDVHTIFVVSDGKPTGGSILNLVQQLQANRNNNDVVIHTIGIGEDQDVQLMCELARSNHGIYIRDGKVVCTASPCPENEGIVTYYRSNHPEYHHYSVSTSICSLDQPGCSDDLVYKTMISQAKYGAPTSSSYPVEHCSIKQLNIHDWLGDLETTSFHAMLGDLRKYFTNVEDPIAIVLNHDAKYQINYTLPGHVFYPGRISRTIKILDRDIIIETEGVGIGDWALVNEVAGKHIFSIIDKELQTEVERVLMH